jgi:hypothetical protein
MNIDKKGGLGVVFLIILAIAVIVTVSVIIFYKPEPKIVVSDEVVAYSKLKGCDTDNGQVWCTINSKCIDLQKETCEKTTVTDSFGCNPSIGEKWCIDKCQTTPCNPSPVVNTTSAPVVNTTPVPIVNTTPVPIVNTTPAPVVNTTTNLTPVVNMTPITNPNTTFGNRTNTTN